MIRISAFQLDMVEILRPHNQITPFVKKWLNNVMSYDSPLRVNVVKDNDNPGKYKVICFIELGRTTEADCILDVPEWDVRGFFGPTTMEQYLRLSCDPRQMIEAVIDIQNNLTVME